MFYLHNSHLSLGVPGFEAALQGTEAGVCGAPPQQLRGGKEEGSW